MKGHVEGAELADATNVPQALYCWEVLKALGS